MGAIVEAVDLVVGEAGSTPLSLGVAAGEIVGLLFPPGKPRVPVLRALAGLDPTIAGEVRFGGRGRVVVATPGPGLSEALSMQPDLVLLDAANDVADHNAWARLASERAVGTSFVVATSNLGEACHCDRVSLASWEIIELSRAVTDLARDMNSQVQEFLAVLGEGRHRRSASMAADLRRLNVGSRALLAEMRRCARARNEMRAWQAASEELAGASVSERMLDAVLADSHDP
jgi:hypothetical protein